MKTSKKFLSSLKLLCNSDTRYTHIESECTHNILECTHIELRCTLTANFNLYLSIFLLHQFFMMLLDVFF